MADRRRANVSDTLARYPEPRQGERRTGTDRRDGQDRRTDHVGRRDFDPYYVSKDRRQADRRKG